MVTIPRVNFKPYWRTEVGRDSGPQRCAGQSSTCERGLAHGQANQSCPNSVPSDAHHHYGGNSKFAPFQIIDIALGAIAPSGSRIQEVANEMIPRLMWQMDVIGQLAYRRFRMPSLYPGVQWNLLPQRPTRRE